MRWPIRNQILLPFVGVLLLTISATALATAYLAAKRSEAQTVRQLEAAAQTLAQSNFPLTRNVLDKMRGLSGAHFVVRGEDGRVVESTLADLQGNSAVPFEVQTGDVPAALGGHTKLLLSGAGYFAAELAVQGRTDAVTLVILYPEASWSQARRDAAMPPLAIGAVAIVLMVVVAFWLANRFSSRIRQIQHQVGAIAAGDFRAIPLGPREDELQQLVASVNSMCRQLQRMQEAVRDSERTRLLGQLAGGLAHQLRNAITGARMAVQVHQQRCRTDAHDESLSVVLRQLALTEGQVKGLLSLGRLERPPRSPCDVNQLIDEVAMLVGPACQHAHVALRHSNESNGTRLLGYADDLRAVLLNLTLNAIEAAGPNGTVCVRSIMDDGLLRIDVIDSGAGPPPEIGDTLFEPFVTGKPEGVGLGLALARQVADDHGGRIAWSRDAGQTCFRLELPAGAETSTLLVAIADEPRSDR